MFIPKHIILISGKRKCGKDYIAETLLKRIQDGTIVRISEPVKSYYAEQHHLDLHELMTDGPYKEVHRKAMIDWSDAMRAQEPGYFCAIACSNAAQTDTWIVSDVRRQTDVAWFSLHYRDVLTKVRITADEDVRQQRGWHFTPGVDDVVSECDLDKYEEWDLNLTNNTVAQCDRIIDAILEILNA